MKTPGQVAQKMKQAQYRHIKREIESLLKKTPPNCKSNRTLDLDIGPVGVCALDCEVCDLRFENRAPGCEKWEARHRKGEIKASLKDFFKTRTRAEIAVRFPDVAALLWVISEEEAANPPVLLEEVCDLLGVESGDLLGHLSELQGELERAREKEEEVQTYAQEAERLRGQLEALLLEPVEEPEVPAPVPWWRRWLPWG